MSYVQALTGHGGWPLSAWLTPGAEAVSRRHLLPARGPHDGRPGFPSLLRTIADGWAQDREKLVAEADRVIATLREHLGAGPTA